MPGLQRAAEIELARRYLLPFIKLTRPFFIAARAQVLICNKLQEFERKVEKGLSPRLIINMSPRTGKSEIVSRCFPAWTLGRHPDWYFGLVSYGDDLAEELSQDARGIVMDGEFGEIFGGTYATEDDVETIVQIDLTSKSVRHWKLKDHRGGMRAAGINGALVGRGYNIVVFDDPTKNRESADSLSYRDKQWTQYKGTFYNRVEPGGGIIIMAQRWGEDDVVGRALKEAADNPDDPDVDQWEIITIPAEALPTGVDPLGRQPGEFMDGRFTDAQWRKIKANTMAVPRNWWALYQQVPIAEDGQIFHPYEDFIFAPPPTDIEGDEYFGPRFGFVDSSHAKKRESDYSVIGIWQIEPEHTLGLLDVFRGRVQYPVLKSTTRQMYNAWGCWGIVIEDYSSGVALAQEFKVDAHMKVGTWRPDRDKVARAHSATDVLASWRVRLPEGNAFPSGLPVSTYINELSSFRGSGDEHDDMVDMTTMALYLMGTRRGDQKRIPITAGFSFGG